MNQSCFDNDILKYDNFDYDFFEQKESKIYNEIDEKNSEEESSTNTSSKSNDSLEEYENELDRFFPSNILEILKYESFNSKENDNKKENENKKEKIMIKPDNILKSFFNKLNINSKPFFPKAKLPNKSSSNNENNKEEDSNLNINCKYFNKNNHSFHHISNNNNSNKNRNKKNQKKKGYIEKEGDWPCYDCKNINFSFRDVCNRCRLPKEESEKKYREAGEKLIKLFIKNKNNEIHKNENTFNLKKEVLIR